MKVRSESDRTYFETRTFTVSLCDFFQSFMDIDTIQVTSKNNQVMKAIFSKKRTLARIVLMELLKQKTVYSRQEYDPVS